MCKSERIRKQKEREREREGKKKKEKICWKNLQNSQKVGNLTVLHSRKTETNIKEWKTEKKMSEEERGKGENYWRLNIK